MTIWDAGQYVNAFLSDLKGAGLVSVATKKNTAQIWFRYSGDAGATWSTPTLVATLANRRAAHIHQRSDGSLIVTNGIDFVARSTDFGATWTEI